jgi:acyl carrier protein
MPRRDKICEILKKVSKQDAVPAGDESLFESGWLDSFVLTDLVSELEDSFGIKVPDSDLRPKKFDTIEMIDAYVAGQGN